MSKIRPLLALTLTLLLLTACNVNQSTDVNKVPGNTQVEGAGSTDVRHTIKFYTDQLKSKDPENLVGFFIPEGQTDVHPIDDAKKTLEKYTQENDLSTIEYKLKDIVGNVYMYDVYGTKNGKTVRHEVSVACGNGLTGIQDT